MKNILIGTALLVLGACSQSKKTGMTEVASASRENGFLSLFDGKTLDGWRGYQNKSSASWSVENGVVHCQGGENNYGAITADLITNETFKDFDFRVDYKISPKGNSGILYMVTEDYPYSHKSGPEYQLIDDVNFPEKLEKWQMTAANYAMNDAPDARPNPAGEWNHARIVKHNDHVEHWLNGKKVVEYDLYSDDWKKRKAAGKWKDEKGYAASESGHIAFQNHGSEAWFKNIRIKRLD